MVLENIPYNKQWRVVTAFLFYFKIFFAMAIGG
jgi:hypothetical protein